MNNERAIWNAKYAEGSHASLEPDAFLIKAFEEYIFPLLPQGGSALDVAGGVGRHAIWLAKHGWKATLLDISDEAIALARKNAKEASIDLDPQLNSAEAFFAQHPEQQFNLVLVFFFLQRELFPALLRQLKPGGLLIYKTYTLEQLRLSPDKGPTHPMHLLKANELLSAFGQLEILFYRETRKERGIAELVASKRFV